MNHIIIQLGRDNMCGRFYIDDDDKEMQVIKSAIERKARDYPENIKLKTGGDIFPTDLVPVQTGLDQYESMKWGFAGFDGKPVINARSETALQKPMFQKSMLERRCLIPASGYYEWQKSGSRKIQFRFHRPGGLLYLAGCFRQEKNSGIFNFVILTAQAVNGLEVIHDRMPVIIPHDHINTWLNESPDAAEYAIRDLAYEAVQ